MSQPTQPLQTPFGAAPVMQAVPASPYDSAQWQMPPSGGAKPELTAAGAWVGGGLLTLGGLLSVIGAVMLNGDHLSQVLSGLRWPSFGSVLLILLALESIFGDLVLGIVALAAARRHLVAVAVVALALNVINTVGLTWQYSSLSPSLSVGPMQPMFTVLAHLLVACLLLALALSSRATIALKIIALAVLAMLLINFISASPWGAFGDAHTLTVVWLLSAGAILAVAGWLVLVAGIKTPGAPSELAKKMAKLRG
ncbi:MAG: hypothetical protein FWF36_06170 [Propionibacteriaceae bacterium]|nr:hypothetical protein [Propionibacteriaceae bacterium]